VRSATHANGRLVPCLGLISLALCARPARLDGQGATTTLPMPGFAAAHAAGQRVLEDGAVGRLNPDAARAHSRALSAETHVAGTPAQLRTRDYVLEQMRTMGLRTEVRSYSVFMPHAVSVRLWRTAPTERELPLGEPLVEGGGKRHGSEKQRRRRRPFMAAPPQSTKEGRSGHRTCIFR